MPGRQPWMKSLDPELARQVADGRWAFDNATDPLVIVRTIEQWENVRRALLLAAIKDARREGASWADIGSALGQPRQQAHRTWARLIEDETLDG